MVYNPYIVVPLATWAVAQVAKFAIAAMQGRIDFRYLYASGGMPSVHSAVVNALATTALLVDGPGSAVFGFACVFSAIVMYDSFGVRRSSGEQAMVINTLLDNLDRNRFKLDTPLPRLREILGHQPREVAAGAATGIILAMLFNYTKLGQFGTFLQTVPKMRELIVYAAIFGVLVIGGLIARVALRRRYRKSAVIRRFTSHVFTASETVGLLGLITAVLAYEHASYMAWRLWPLTVIGIGAVWAVWILTGSARDVPAGLAAEATAQRKRKWLNFGRKSKK